MAQVPKHGSNYAAKQKWFTRLRFPTAIGVIDCIHIHVEGKPAQFGD